jgi:hypothetical protein
MAYPIAEYRSQASQAFPRLLPIFETCTNGWQVGNVFDTLTDYVLRFPDAEPSKGAVVEAASERWKAVEGMCWYDDYGWWGIASAKAFDDRYADVFGSYRDEFQAIATDCWNVMHTGKPDVAPYKWKGGPMVWENRDEGSDPGYFSSKQGWAVPRFPGGVWQYDMFRDARPEPPECSPDASNPSDPNACVLGPFQNTVMNGLYLELALRLTLQGKGTGTADAAGTELKFLRTWFQLQGNESLLQPFSDGSTLVRERVATYAEFEGAYPQVNGYAAENAWCGDQGLLVGGLLDNLLVNPSDPDAQSQAIAIARGVLLHMTDDCGVMAHSAIFDDHGDEDDYSCGSGVFWRYLLHGFDQNAALKTALLGDPALLDAINLSAMNVGERVAKSKNPLFAGFNVIATLLTAIEVLEQANG